MQIVAFGFPVAGLICCLVIALRPQHMERHVQRVRRAWGYANTLERVGLVFMCVPIPGPFDECIGFVFLGLGRVQRLIQRRAVTDMTH